MAQSVFAANATQFIDGVDQDFAVAGAWNLGVEYLGASKAFVRRCLAGFDVLGPAAAGRPLVASDAITAAELVMSCFIIIGGAGWAAVIERLARADWDYLAADWTRYRTGANWTVAGGDVGTPPAAVAFTSPVATGEQVVGGMEGYVTDAIANRSGKVLLRLRAVDEAPQQARWCAYDANLSSSARVRLRVTYTAADPAPIATPAPPVLRGDRPAAPVAASSPAVAGRPATPHRP